jgi:hypothetical protein
MSATYFVTQNAHMGTCESGLSWDKGLQRKFVINSGRAYSLKFMYLLFNQTFLGLVYFIAGNKIGRFGAQSRFAKKAKRAKIACFIYTHLYSELSHVCHQALQKILFVRISKWY